MSKFSNQKRQRTLDYRAELLAKARAMRSASEFIEPLDVPRDLSIALATGRAELIRLAQPRAMDAAEVAVLYKLIAGLFETNQAQVLHAEEVSRMADHFYTMTKGALKLALDIGHFAAFRTAEDDEDDEGEDA